jgi:hypothetical protein
VSAPSVSPTSAPGDLEAAADQACAACGGDARPQPIGLRPTGKPALHLAGSVSR